MFVTEPVTTLPSEEDLIHATVLDFHVYSVNGLAYKQKVYRLKDHRIYVETIPFDDSIEDLQQKLKEAIEAQDFEGAAVFRDRIKLRK